MPLPPTADRAASASHHHAHEPRTPLWRNLNFTLMWTSTAASGFGDRMMMLAALALLGGFGLAAESTQINAGTQFWFFLPYFLFSIFFGWVADHLPRKWIMLGCDETRAAILLFAIWLIPAGMVAPNLPDDRHWQVFACLFAIGCMAALFNPTRNAIIPQLVPLRQLAAANAMLLGIGVIASMIGLVIGNFIIDPDHAATVRRGLIVAVAFYAISGTFFAFLRLHHAKPPKEVRKTHTFKQAALYVWNHKRIIKLMFMHILIWGAAMIVYNSVLAIGKELFGFRDAALQSHFVYMGGLLGAGMLVGAGIVAFIGTRRQVMIPMMVGILCAGLCILLVAWVPVVWISFVLAFGVGLFGNVVIICLTTMMQSLSPNYIRGRIMGLDSTINTAATVAINYFTWQLPDADRNIMYVLYGLGPLLMVIGLVVLLRYLTRGPMKTAGANFFRHFVQFFALVWHRLEWEGLHHIPRSGPVVLACNHTTALDPFLLQAACPRQIRWLMLESYRFKIINFFWKIIDPIFLDDRGPDGQVVGAGQQVRQIVRELKQNDCVGIFPEGHVQYESRVLKEFQEGAAVAARLSGAAIVPCWVEGTPRSRKMWVHFLKPTRSRLSFGPPIWPDKTQTPAAVTEELRRRMLALATEPQT